MKTFKHPKYTFIKNNTFYFSRSVPVDLRCFYSKPRIFQSLRTKSSAGAHKASKLLSHKLDEYWLNLRIKTTEVPAAHLLIHKGVDALPTIEDAPELYLNIKGVGRQKLFFTTAQRYIGYMIECLGERPNDQYSSRDATLLREWLLKKRI